MQLGPRLVIQGTILGALLLSGFLYLVASGINYPQSVRAADNGTPAPPVTEAEATQTAAAMQASDSGQNAVSVEAAIPDVCEVSPKFPESILQWCNLISYYAKERNLPPDLVAALIWQESGGNPAAYSKSGAVGLMQVMPRDGLAASFMCINGPCFSDRPTTESLKDPEFNVRYGTEMLARLISKYGNYRDALKAYGPMNVGYYYADKVLGIFQQYGQ